MILNPHELPSSRLDSKITNNQSHRSTVQEVAEKSGAGSAEHVIAHAKRQQARGKAPSMPFGDISNPRAALAAAEATVAARQKVADTLIAANIIIRDTRERVTGNFTGLTQKEVDRMFSDRITRDQTVTDVPSNRSHRSTVQEVAEKSGAGSAEHVIAHAKRQQARGKAPSMPFGDISNPRAALAAAEAKVMADDEARRVIGAAEAALSEAQCKIAQTLTEADQTIFIDWTGGTVEMPRLGGYIVPKSKGGVYEKLHHNATTGQDPKFMINEIYGQGYPAIGLGSPEGTSGKWGHELPPSALLGQLTLETIRTS